MLDTGAPYYDTYETADGKYMAVGAIEPQFYAELLTGLGLFDQANVPDRNDVSQWESLRAMFTQAFRTRTRDEWAAVFDGIDACVTPVLTFAEAATDSHMTARATVSVIDNVMQASVAPRFSRSSPSIPNGPARVATDPGEVWNG
jgi:alpha-methylacyl-CoA racemase